MTLRKLFSFRQTPQNEPVPGAGQVANEAGGYTWPVDNWARLDRFLVLGSESGTYYVGPRKLTRQNAIATLECIEEDGLRVVDRVIEISESGRAPKNDPALFVLALCAAAPADGTRRAALEALPRVAGTGTYLFHFLEFVKGFRGWDRDLRRAVGRWYSEKSAHQLAYQAVKYRQRDGWRHRDALRLARPKAATKSHQAIFHWMVNGWPDVGDIPHPDNALRVIWALERAQRASTRNEVISLVGEHRLPWEAVPAPWLGSPQVWRTLAPQLPLMALLCNLGRMTANGALVPFGRLTSEVAAQLTDADGLQAARIHPIAVLSALVTYSAGRGQRGQQSWTPIGRLVDALDLAFYRSFVNVEPTGKRLLLGLDVSGSIARTLVNGVPGLPAQTAKGAIALVNAAVERDHLLVAFDTKAYPLHITPRERLDNVVDLLAHIGGGGTDCTIPMRWAIEHRVPVDAFIILTDSQTSHGRQHPAQTIQDYRREIGAPAKLVVVAMTANHHSIGGPHDVGVLTVVGFDTATPQLIADFIRS